MINELIVGFEIGIIRNPAFFLGNLYPTISRLGKQQTLLVRSSGGIRGMIEKAAD